MPSFWTGFEDGFFFKERTDARGTELHEPDMTLKSITNDDTKNNSNPKHTHRAPSSDRGTVDGRLDLLYCTRERLLCHSATSAAGISLSAERGPPGRGRPPSDFVGEALLVISNRPPSGVSHPSRRMTLALAKPANSPPAGRVFSMSKLGLGRPRLLVRAGGSSVPFAERPGDGDLTGSDSPWAARIAAALRAAAAAESPACDGQLHMPDSTHRC